MTYWLLAHFENVENHRQLIERVLHGWNENVGVPLLFFSNKGAGEEIGPELLDRRGHFGRLDDAIDITFRSSRKRDAFKLELYFTNPARNWYGDRNFVSATFPESWIEQSEPSFITELLSKFCGNLIDLTQSKSLAFEHEDLGLLSPGNEVLGALGEAISGRLGHMCFLGQDALTQCNGTPGLMRAGWTIHRKWDHGCLASIPYDSSLTRAEEAWRLFDVLERSRLLLRDPQAALDLSNADFITSDKAGAFLNSFERALGRVLAVKCSDGYQPVGSALEASGH